MRGCLLHTPLSHQLRTGPATQACALTGNETSNPLVGRPALNPISHASQGEVSSLTDVLFSSVLFSQHLFWDFQVFFLLLVFNLIPLWFESRHCMISILLEVLRCVLWPRMCSVIVNVPC